MITEGFLMISRGDGGRFVPGTPGGPGRPKRTDFADLLRKTITDEQAKEIYRQAIKQAERGDAKARTWLFSFLMSPAPRTLKVEAEETLEGRKTIDAIIENLPDELAIVLEVGVVKKGDASKLVFFPKAPGNGRSSPW